jgi:hypothetical protein
MVCPRLRPARGELRYILDPADVHGPDFPGETFRVLKEKEFAKFVMAPSISMAETATCSE